MAATLMKTKTRIKPNRAADVSGIGILVEVAEFWKSRRQV